MKDEQIALPLVERSFCPVCRGAGAELYSAIRDTLFDTPGLWNVRRCIDPRCGTLWIDPAPAPSALESLYRNYYTHTESAGAEAPPSAGGGVRRAYWARRFGYPYHEPLWARLCSLAFVVLPIRSARLKNDVYHLHYTSAGTSLEVGCGTGEMIAALAHHGWRAQGIDFDARAIASARRNGLDVHCGDLTSAQFEGTSFDAVVSRHVLEHLPDPDAYWTAAKRLLKPGGTLVVVTPNARALGHRIFRRHWRGLEVPRHLCVFTPRALATAATKAGFELRSIRTGILGTKQIFDESNRIREAFGLRPHWLPPAVAEWIEWLADLVGLKIGEETILVATKPRQPRRSKT